MAFDVTGLKIYGEGEWKVQYPNQVSYRRYELLPNLSKQTRQRIIEISDDDAGKQGQPCNLAVGCQKLYGSNKH